MRNRAQLHFPTVLLTLISIIQALALELLWSKVVESEFLFSFNLQSVIGWGMVMAAFFGILQIWVLYTTMVMGFVWQPLLRDSIVPFIIGIQEFMLITLIGVEFSTLWLYVLASVFISAHWVSHNSLRRARNDPENEAFFKEVKPATLRDFWPPIAIVMMLVIFGIAIDITDQRSWMPLLAIVCTNTILIGQIYAMSRLWGSMMGLSETERKEN